MPRTTVVLEPFTAVVSPIAESGELKLLVEVLAGAADTRGRRFTISAWREGFRTIRLSVRAEDSGTIAYLQGGLPLLALAADLGIVRARRRSNCSENGHRGRS